MTLVESAIVIVKTAVLVFGGLITYFAYRAYRRTGAVALRALTVGFGFVTTGALLAGVLDLLTPLDVRYSLLIESVLTLVGFVVITYSLYVE